MRPSLIKHISAKGLACTGSNFTPTHTIFEASVTIKFSIPIKYLARITSDNIKPNEASVLPGLANCYYR